MIVALALGNASCVPVTASQAPDLALARPAALLPMAAIIPSDAMPAAPVALAVTIEPAAASLPFRGRSAIDEMRSLSCLAQAIYYEAASESEAGQRAVAQVVLNRVRHPAWPNSVCGVVYQGPMRAGGGCQFTFTCDGSLARTAAGPAWIRARMLAAEALAGRAFAEVGLSTHYHTHAVSPSWAPRLQPTAIIGAHRFYRLPGHGGMPRAFAAIYSGSESIPHPSSTLLRAFQRPSATTFAATDAAVRLVSAIPSDPTGTAPIAQDSLPPSTIREEYRHSGQWRTDAPAAISGR